MDARATLNGSRSSTRFPITIVVALLAALAIGWMGGYLGRGLALSTSTTNTVTTPRPYVVESPPYGSPAASPTPAPILDPDGGPVPI